MSDLDALVKAYSRFVALPWEANLAYPQRVWMVVYPPSDERRLRMRIAEFDIATVKAGHGWKLLDLTDAFARWLGGHEYREAYFEEPELLTGAALEDFSAYVRAEVLAVLGADNADADTAVALLGVGALFPFYKVSHLLDAVNGSVCGRLVVFFPGERDGSNYRLLEARDGWNYLATPITATEEPT
jgi:Domain of unknown function (DUF1788)